MLGTPHKGGKNRVKQFYSLLGHQARRLLFADKNMLLFYFLLLKEKDTLRSHRSAQVFSKKAFSSRSISRKPVQSQNHVSALSKKKV